MQRMQCASESLGPSPKGCNVFKSCSTACPVIVLWTAWCMAPPSACTGAKHWQSSLQQMQCASESCICLLRPPAVWLLAHKCCKLFTMPTAFLASLHDRISPGQSHKTEHALPEMGEWHAGHVEHGLNSERCHLPLHNSYPEVIHQAFRCVHGSYWISEGFLCRAEWHEWAQKPDEADDDYAMRIRMAFTFSVEDVPAHLRQKDHHTDGRSAAKQGAFSITLPASSGCSQQRCICHANKRLSSMIAIVSPSQGCAHTPEAEGPPHRQAQRC